jgi:hypothetical protein
MSVTSRARSSRRIGQRFGKIVITLAVALTGAAITAPGASAAACVQRSFSEGSTGQCVLDEQVLLNDLTYHNWPGGPNPTLATDGDYGPKTGAAVAHFNCVYGIYYGLTCDIGFTEHPTWSNLCAAVAAAQHGDVGYYWRNAGC